MPPAVPVVTPARHAEGGLRDAQRAMFILMVLTAFSLGVFVLCLSLFGPPKRGDRLQFPFAFAVTTVLLFCASFSIRRAEILVRQERQVEFRRWLKIAGAIASLFMGVQAYGLLWMTPGTRSATMTSLGVRPFVMVLAGLHAMHFFVATLFVSVVLSRSIADRYDHEYHWGVTICAWFWHMLGIAWVAILAIFAIAFGS